MISLRRLAELARRWLRAAAASRKAMAPNSDASGISSLARKGRVVVYSQGGQRFEVSLAYLKSDIFRELLRMSEDVFGLPAAGLITLSCNATFMGGVASCLRRQCSRDA